MAIMPLERNISAAPPQSAQSFRSDDLDEVRKFVTDLSGYHTRVVHGTGALGFEQAWLSGAAATPVWVRSGLATTIRGAPSQPFLHIMLAGAEYRIGRRRHACAPGTAMFLPPGWEYRLDRPSGAAFALVINHSRLVEEIEAREPGARGSPVLRASRFASARLATSGLMAAIAVHVQAAGRASGPASLATGEAQLLGTLADLLRNEAAVVRGTEVAASRLADLEGWIEANLEAPISMGRLCAVAGVGERALQQSFERRRGMSPMRFVVERRLAEARRRLTHANPREDVTQVAIQLGFNHIGRFASLYRPAFGELPSQSLRRSRRQV